VLPRWWGQPAGLTSSIVFVRRPAVDSSRFDTLVRSLGRPATRRTTLRHAGGAVAAVVAAGVTPGLAARQGKRRGKRPRQRPGQSPETGSCQAPTDCGSGEACLGGACVRIVVPIGATAPDTVSSPYAVAVGGGHLCVTDVFGADDHVRIFSLSAAGQLTRIGSTPDVYSWALGVAIDAAGRLYVGNSAGVRVYAINPDGSAHRVADVPNLRNASGVAAAGRLLFVADRFAGVVRIFRIVASDPPTYPLLATLDGFKEPDQLAADDGRLYVADTHDDRVAVYGINPTSGQATFQRSIPILNPSGVAVGGGQLFVSSEVGSRVYGFDLAADGTPTLATVLTQSDRRFKEPHGLALSGDFLFVADNDNSQVAVFRLL
jgi:6-phosphogluconolactonase (cycloisomerase 2 family)